MSIDDGAFRAPVTGPAGDPIDPDEAGAAGAAKVAVIMGSQSDWDTMRHTAETLDELAIPYEALIVSAHRTPRRLYDFATTASETGYQVIIAGAGGAAHLPGMVAAMTMLPVFGVPVESRTLSGWDSLLSIVQMPAGVPVGTLAIGKAGAINAALLAASVLALSDDMISASLVTWREMHTAAVADRPGEDRYPEDPADEAPAGGDGPTGE